MWPLESKGQAAAREYLLVRNGQIEKATHIEKHEDLQEAILSSDIVGLVDGIKEKKWTSTIVVRVFITSAIRAHRKLNCLTEVNFDFALQRAKELDAAFAQTGEVVGPLHGVPFSLKDQFDLRGKYSSVGYTEWMLRDPAAEDCGIAQIAQHYGAIPICKTNVPQTMLSYECNNPVWGRSLNPYNIKHTPGGSSGGEAALLASDGAAFGFGSDIGGSLRIPTSFSGVYALKPTAGRTFPFSGSVDMGEGALTLDVTAAPMTRNVADLQLLTTLYYNAMCPPADGVTTARDIQRRFNLDNKVEASPLRPAWFDPIQAVSSRSPLRQKLRVGYYYCDGMNKTSPACVRAVEMAKTALSGIKTTSGAPVIQMVEIDPKLLDIVHALQIFVGITSANGYDNLTKHLGNDWKDPSTWLIFFPVKFRALKAFAWFLARFIIRDAIMARIMSAIFRKTTTEFFSWRYKMQLFNKQFEERIWKGLDLDCIICPVLALPAVTHKSTITLSSLAANTILYNIVDVPVTVVPVTRVDPKLDSHLPKSSSHRKWKSTKGFNNCSKMTESDMYRIYDAEKWAGLPVGVQLVTQRGQEELAIGMMKLLDQALGPRGFAPGRSLSS